MGTLLAVSAPMSVANGQSRAAPGPLRIGYLAPLGDTMAALAYRRGVELGINEARHAGRLLDRDVGYVELSAGRLPETAYADGDAGGVHALIAPIFDRRILASLGEWAERSRIPVVALGRIADARCAPYIFRISPPPSVDAATLLARGTQSGVSRFPPSADPRMQIAFWHPSLERFGAAQLSDRFRAQHGVAMTSDAWAGWMAVKIIWESSLRAAVTPDALRHAIARSGFDGHKGRALRFGPDNILRHPLMVVMPDTAPDGADSLVAEVDWPESASAHGSSQVDSAAGAGGAPGPSTSSQPCGNTA